MLLAISGCDSGAGQTDFLAESEDFTPTGYTATNADGVVDSSRVDPNDWRTAPLFRGSVVVSPAAPNPVGREGFVTITVQDTFGDALTGGVFVSAFVDGRTIRLDTEEAGGPFYTLSFPAALLRTTATEQARLYRLRIFTNDFRIISYGDLLVQ